MPNTVEFHRVLRATPERVYRGFLDPDALVKCRHSLAFNFASFSLMKARISSAMSSSLAHCSL